MIVSFITEQGGVGKTSLCFNIAWYLNQKNKKVLMVDLDAQGGNLSYVAGVDNLEDRPGIIDILKKKQITPHNAIYTIKKGLEIICANETAVDLPEAMKKTKNYECLKDILKELEGEYDYIFIDTNPTPSIIHAVTLIASDGIVIPLLPDGKSIEGTKHVIDTYEMIKENYNENLKVLGLVYNRYENRTRLAQAVESAIGDYANAHNIKVTKTKIVSNINIAETTLYNIGITEYAPKSKGAACYKDLAKELFKVR